MQAKKFLRVTAIFVAGFLILFTALLSFPACWPQHNIPPFADRLLLAVKILCLAGNSGPSVAGNLMVLPMTIVAGLFYLFTANVLIWHSGLVYRENRPGFFSRQVIVKIGKQVAIISTVAVLVFSVMFWYALGENSLGQSRLYTAIFLAVSAFFNAGFSNMPHGLMNPHLKDFYVLKFLVASAALVGSVGVFTLVNLFSIKELRHRLAHPEVDWLEYTKVAVFGSALMVLLGGTAFFLLEEHHALRGLNIIEQGIAAYGMSIAPKGSGFSLFALHTLQPATLVLIMVLMFFGAMPGAASGGAGILVVFYALKSPRGENADFSRAAGKTVLSLVGLIILAALVFWAFSKGLGLTEALFHAVSSVCSVGWDIKNGQISSTVSQWLTLPFLLAGRYGVPVMLYFFMMKERTKGNADGAGIYGKI